uniref:DEUBAD domain-containing protein n=1 Tax=Noccaea caerulescens TaxID=107243 RepID=A0A1J3JGV7_NOCCA
MNKSQAVGADSEGDSDNDYDLAEANCELAMVQGQRCSIPYELYDLPDLTGILSTETWNSLLTEEERFFLSCFLPDMDQETFSLTMLELLGAANLYFGNPVDQFYQNLRGGLLAPKVACCREGAMFVKRNMYYYSLKLYHEKMINTFTKMQWLWDQYGRELGKNTRLLLWSERKRRENLKLLDLNRVPSERMAGRLTTPKVVKSLERNRAESLTCPRGGGSSRNTLKINITEKGIFRYQGPSLVSSVHHQSLPKGLLKVVPKSSSAILGVPCCVLPRNNLLQIHETSSVSTSFAASPYSGTRFEKPYGTIAYSVPELPKCLLNHQDTTFAYLETEPVSHDPTRTIPRGSGALDNSFTQHNLPTKQEEYAHYHLETSGFKRGIVGRGSETMETERISSGNNFQRDAREPLRVMGEDNQVRETEDDHLFSLTYKRRKVQQIGVA